MERKKINNVRSQEQETFDLVQNFYQVAVQVLFLLTGANRFILSIK